MAEANNFLDPGKHALVSASAGTGKTWTLTARILRLLLEGASPDSILAITYTRAAAAEIRQRLTQRMDEWLHLDDAQLDQKLQELKIPNPDAAMRAEARQLFERVQFSEHGLYISTFHSFFHDLLARFPLEGEVPKDFQIPTKEQSSKILKQAIDQTLQDAEREPDGTVAKALDQAIARFGWNTVLEGFFPGIKEKILEWTAFDRDRSIDDHRRHLYEEVFEIEDGPVEETSTYVITADMDDKNLRQLADLMERLGGKIRTEKAERIRDALVNDSHNMERFAHAICMALHSQQGSGDINKRLHAPKSANLPSAEVAEYEKLLIYYATASKELHNEYRRRKNCEFNLACYTLIRQFAKHYRQIKRSQGVLEYDDLQESAHHMLTEGANTRGTLEWVQIKLGQSFRHILIDEFQDTDLMSWHTVHALFEALREGNEDDTEFIVGDVKQSIYQWRRAKPAVLQKAREYFEDDHAAIGSLDLSYRSAPAILEFVNAWNARLEQTEDMAGLPGFQEHTTHWKDLYGRVELLPLIEKPEKEAAAEQAPMRNPLKQPREAESEVKHPDLIAQAIARHLHDTIIGNAVIQDRGSDGQEVHRHARYSDVMILVRRRTSVRNLERALSELNIPFARQSRQTLLQALEISDLLAVLKFLLNPADNLSLAHVLRSPLYGASNEDLIRLALDYSDITDWSKRLSHYADAHSDDGDDPLCRAERQLRAWRHWADRIPTHDLLDQIYHEGEVLERYRSIWEGDRGQQAAHNLIRFMELALELNSGRYPSLTFFVHYVEGMRVGTIEGADAPDMIAVGSPEQEDRVRIQTVHAAKGLESPIVIYAEMSNRTRGDRASDILMEWPIEEARPTRFLINPGNRDDDTVSEAHREQKKEQGAQEQRNVDYVAFTRARQYLVLYFPDGDYRELLQESIGDCGGQELADPDQSDVGPIWRYESQIQQEAQTLPTPDVPALEQADQLLLQRPPRTKESASSGSAGETAKRHTPQVRGTTIHRLLEVLSAGEPTAAELARIARKCHRTPEDAEFLEWLDEARMVREDPELAEVFQPEPETRVHVEVPVLLDNASGGESYGRIDRLLVSDTEAWIIDFKSNRPANEDELAQIAADYQDQMQRYARCIRHIYPKHDIRCSLLFTASRTLHALAVAV